MRYITYCGKYLFKSPFEQNRDLIVTSGAYCRLSGRFFYVPVSSLLVETVAIRP